MRTFRQPSIVFSLFVAAACGVSSSSDEGTSAPARSANQGSDGFSTAGSSAPATAGGSVTGKPGAATPSAAAGATGTSSRQDEIEALPPEKEMTVSFQLPQASEHYVYTVNPNAGTVAIIDATTQAIQTIKTGSQPTYLRTLEGTDNAIVLNTGSNKASILRVNDDKAQKSDLPVNAGANAIAVAPDGKHAVVYYNASYMSAGKTPARIRMSRCSRSQTTKWATQP